MPNFQGSKCNAGIRPSRFQITSRDGAEILTGGLKSSIWEVHVTRINCVPVEELGGPHLVAEYRELPRVFALARRAAQRGTPAQPPAYTLGKGHLLFFYTRLGYLAKRHAELVEEMKRRGYKPAFPGINAAQYPEIPASWWADWVPTPEAIALNRQRIRERNAAVEARRAATVTTRCKLRSSTTSTP